MPSDAQWKIVPSADEGPDWKKWTPRSRQWPVAVEVGIAWWANWPGIYQAVTTGRWSFIFGTKPWFQISMDSLCVIALAGCLFLISRLFVQSQLKAVVGRERVYLADQFAAGLNLPRLWPVCYSPPAS